MSTKRAATGATGSTGAPKRRKTIPMFSTTHCINSSYMQGFSAGKKCGIDNCANALKASYQQINQC